MRFPLVFLGAVSFTALGLYGCSKAPGRPVPGEMPAIPGEISDFSTLYQQNCAGCHGQEGKGGAAIALANPVYLAIADDTILRHATTSGISGTAMPAFAQSAGGMLTDKQVDVIVGGIRERWSKPDVFGSHIPGGLDPPPYSSSAPGDSTRGSEVYAAYCSSCHGVAGRGGQKASSIVEGSFLALISDQELRTIVITGRPELGAPDWRGDVPGKPMSAQDVSDVVAWLASQRPKFPGQPFPTTATAMGEIR
jgi:cytochrome c oxidase cbb3-type subunit 3